MPDTQPFAVYETTASNSLSFTDNSHSLGTVTGVIERGRTTGFSAQAIDIPNVGSQRSVQEFPSLNAGLNFDPDLVIGWPMDRG